MIGLADHLAPVHNVIVSNVVGSPVPVYLAGAEVVGMYPFGPLMEGTGLNITVLSNAGQMNIGLVACRDLVPGLDGLLTASWTDRRRRWASWWRRRPIRAFRPWSTGSITSAMEVWNRPRELALRYRDRPRARGGVPAGGLGSCSAAHPRDGRQLHGPGAEVMPRLAEHHDVIAPDLMGHGESAKPLGDYSLGAFASGLRDLLSLLDVPRVTVVGQSLGGGVAMQLAYQHPELVERLVLVSSGGLGREVSWMLRALTLPGPSCVMPVLFPRVVADRGDRGLEAAAPAGHPGPAPERDVAGLRVADRRPEPTGLHPHAAGRGRPRRADGQRQRSPLPDRGDADDDHLG